MRRETRLLGVLCAATLAAAAFAGGCKKDKEAPPPETAAAAAPKGPDYQEFAALKRARTEIALPWVMSEDPSTEAAQCFKPVPTQPGEADVALKGAVDDNLAAARKAIVEWLVEIAEPPGVTRAVAESWEMSFEELVAMEVPPDQVRFNDDPDCLGKSGWLPEDRHLVTAVVGAKLIKLETSAPLGTKMAQDLADAVKAKGVLMEAETLFRYEPARDEQGNPVLDSKGKQLFTSPTGDFIPETEVPTEEARKTKEWTFRMEQPLYFGVRELAADEVRKENSKSKCDVIIIPDVPKPQLPDCGEFRESAFAVTVIEGEDKPVKITIVTGDQTKGVTLDWKEAAKIPVNDRIIVWLQPEKVEVGVNLKLNSLVLHPQPMAEGAGGEDGYGEGGGMYKPQADEEPKKEAREEKKEEKKEKKEKKKKGSDNAIDDYLNQ